MKWNYIFAGLLYFIFDSCLAAIIDVNDPDALVIDSVASWNIFSDTSNNYSNILITQNGVLNISGSASTPGLILNSAAHIEINGSINIQDVSVTLNALDSISLDGSINSNADISIQSPSITALDASSIIAGSANIVTAVEASSIIFGSVNIVTLSTNTDITINQGMLTGGIITMSDGTIVPLPASLWLMLTGLLAFFQIRKKPSNRNKHITPL